MAQQNYDGTAYLVYAATTAPTNAFNKDDANYTVVGELVNTNYDRIRAAIEKSSKQDGDESTFIAGRRNRKFNFSARFDHTEDNGQAKVVDAYESATGVVYLLISTGVAGDLAFHGSGIVTGAPVTVNDGAVSEVSFTVQMSGVVTETTLT